MFTSFDDIFNEDPQTEFKLPDKYIDFISKLSLPDGMKYEADEKGNCKINMSGTEIKIGGIKFTPNKEQLKILGKDFTLDDVLEYSYNSQKKIEISPIEDGFIILNGKKIAIDRLEYNPINPVTLVDGKFYLIPSKMDEKFEINLSDGELTKVLHVQRIPNDSVYVKSFCSAEDESLKITYSYNIKTKELKINVSFNLANALTIKDIVESVSIYNAFIDGKGFICGNLIDIKPNKKDFKKYDEENIIFWKKLLLIENELNIQFIPPKENLKQEEIIEIEELYHSLINKKPFKDRNKINSLDGEWNFEKNETIKACINKTLFFKFDATYSFEILGCEFSLPALIMVFNSKLVALEQNGNNTKIILEDESESNRRYTTKMYFKNLEELKKYEIENESKIIGDFKESKSIFEIIN